jgi:two-component system nitrogen regulation response regulator NtrX
MGDILIVDDERDIRELVSDILEDERRTSAWRKWPKNNLR